MEKDTARVIVTLDCHRACSYCCNKQPQTLNGVEVISSVRRLGSYENVVLTGGEPMLEPCAGRLQEIVRELRQKGNPRIYLNTAIFSPRMEKFLASIHGVTYGLHQGKRGLDLLDFYDMQRLALHYPRKSFHLWVHAGRHEEIPINPGVWKRIRVEEPRDPCPLPPNEDLFILQEALP